MRTLLALLKFELKLIMIYNIHFTQMTNVYLVKYNSEQRKKCNNSFLKPKYLNLLTSVSFKSFIFFLDFFSGYLFKIFVEISKLSFALIF